MPNNLLLTNNVKRETTPVVLHRVRTNKLTPCWRYHKELGSKLLKYDDELDWLGDGWVDHPGKLSRLPGHEKLYDITNNPVYAKQKVSELTYLVKTNEEIEQQSKDAEDAAALKLKTEAAVRDKEIRANPIVHACPDCEQKFDNPRRLHMHRVGKHKYRKNIHVADEKVLSVEQPELVSEQGEPKC